MKSEFYKSGIFKKTLIKLHKDKAEVDILSSFCKLLAHIHIKLYIYKIIITTLDEKKLKYKLKEIELNKKKTVFTIILEPRKTKLAEIEVNEKSIFCTSYNQLCVANFIPLSPRAKIMIRELRDILEDTIDLQRNFLNLLISE
jgi:hypothetical protein